MKSTCTLPSLSEVLTLPSVSCQRGHSRKTYVHPSRIAHNEQFAYSPCIYDDAPLSSMTADQFFEDDEPVKKRKRATPSQLHVLNSVFVRTHFPSTELRMKIGKQLGMSPRTVQIWFQNKRQSRRTKEKSSNNQLMSPPISPSLQQSSSYFHTISTPSSSSSSASSPLSVPVITPPTTTGVEQSPKLQQYQILPTHEEHYQPYRQLKPSFISLPPLRFSKSSASLLSPSSIMSASLDSINSSIFFHN